MPKSHVIKITITNQTQLPMKFTQEWFDTGRVADGWSWPDTIQPGGKEIIECYERDNAPTGCSGYVEYDLGGNGNLTIAFSNPYAGKNKLGVGVGGKSVWDNMDAHDYKPFVESIVLGGKEFTATCDCSGGDVNQAHVILNVR